MDPTNFINDLLTHLIPKFESLGFWTYWLAMLIAFLESLLIIGIFIPGAIIMPFLGFLSAQGIIDISDLIWFTSIGSIMGDLISYYIGTKEYKFFDDKNAIFKETHIKKAKFFFEAHGNKSIFLGKFLGPLRSVIPFIAGLSKMNTKKFIFIDIISSFIWSSSYIILGYLFGSSIHSIQAWSTRLSLVLISIIVIFAILYSFKVLIYKNTEEAFIIAKSIYRPIRETIISNKYFIQAKNNHKKLFDFFQKRFNKEKFTGLPLTIILAISIYIFALLSGITQDVLYSSHLSQIDLKIINTIENFRHPIATKIFLWITILANPIIVGSIGITASIILILIKRKDFIILLWTNIVLAGGLSFLSKLMIERLRPLNPVYIENTFSFPSGHSIMSIVLYGSLAYIFIRNSKIWKREVNAFFLFILIAFLIGSSRLYLGVHYLSDILGGYLIGIFVLIFTVSIFEYYEFHNKKELATLDLSSYTKIFVTLIIIANIIFYIGFGLTWRPLNML